MQRLSNSSSGRSALTSSANGALIRLVKASIRPHLPRNSYSIDAPPPALKDVSWTINQGENWLCTGPNGSGKSTLARSLVGKATVVGGSIFTSIRTCAFVSFADHERVKATTDFFLSHGAKLDQEALTVDSFLDSQVQSYVPDGFLDMPALKGRALASLSSGELRRVYVVKALQSRPDLLVLDEAFDFLDAKRREMLSLALKQYAENHPLTRIVLVSHRAEEDASLFSFITHELQLTGSGSVKYMRSLQPITPTPSPATVAKELPEEESSNISSQASIPQQVTRISKATQPEHGGETGSRERLNLEARNVKLLIERSRQQARDDFPKPYSDRAVDIKEIAVRFDLSGPPVLRVSSLVVRPGDRVALFGPSGAGKSLLLSLVSGEHPQAYSNSVLVFGRQMGVEDSLEDRSRTVGLFSNAKAQSLFTHNPHKPAVEVVASVFKNGHYDELNLQLARDWLELMAPSVPSAKAYMRLSQGQRAAVLLARTLASVPRVLLLDEPFTGLDIEARARLSRVVNLIAQSNQDCAVIGTSHYTGDFESFPRRMFLEKTSGDDSFELVERTPSSLC